MENELFVVGKIVNTHALKGEIRINSMSDDEKKFEKLEYVLIEGKKYELESVRYHKNFTLVKLKGFDSINEVEFLKDKLVEIEKKYAIELNEDEYYISDLIGCNVLNEEDFLYGAITDIIRTGSNDVYVVTPEKGKDILIPAIKQCIIKIDIKNKNVIVKLLEGLLD